MSKPKFGALDDAGTWPVLLPIGAHKHVPSFPIDGTTCVAGSRIPAQIVLNSQLVSKSHLLFVNDRGETYMRDLASTNGVYVNNTPVREARLSDGDILNVGRFRLICLNNFPSELDEEPVPALDAELLIEETGQRTPIRLRTCVIGRRASCDMQLTDDPKISAVHAVIYRYGGRRFLHDLNSKLGTFLNHQRIRDAEVRPGDMIKLGDTIIRYERAPISTRGGWVPDVAAELEKPIRLADEDEGPLDAMTDSSLELALQMHDESAVRTRASENTMVAKSVIHPPAPRSLGDMQELIDLVAMGNACGEEIESIVLHPTPKSRAHVEPRVRVKAVDERQQPKATEPKVHEQPVVQNELVPEHPDLIFEPELPLAYSQSLGNFASALDKADEATTLNEVLAALQPALWHEGPTARNVDLPHSGSSYEPEADPYQRSIDRPVGDFDTAATVEEEETPEAALLDDCFHQETGL